MSADGQTISYGSKSMGVSEIKSVKHSHADNVFVIETGRKTFKFAVQPREGAPRAELVVEVLKRLLPPK